MHDFLRNWRQWPFSLSLYDTGVTRADHFILDYVLTYQKNVVFRGGNYGVPCIHAVDSDEAAAGFLRFLSLGPGDTDREYFRDYSQYQLDFILDHADDLLFWANKLENGELCPECGDVLNKNDVMVCEDGTLVCSEGCWQAYESQTVVIDEDT